MLPDISIVVPLYNEENVIKQLIQRLSQLMDDQALKIEVVLVNDGSKDSTEQQIQALALTDQRYQVVSFSRNFGHQIAVTAGLQYAKGTKAIMVIDGDLQDPPELLDDFYSHFQVGYDIVYGVRKKRKENFLKKLAYHWFYRILKSISYVQLPLDSGDFSLISRRVVDVLNQMPEESRYIRGMRAWTGFRQIGVEYERQERMAGESKYSVKMLFKLAYNGIFNFSEFPIKLITRCGAVCFLLSSGYSLYALVMKIFFDTVPQGFVALLLAITMFGGIQLLSIGVLGEYIIRIFFQTKKRPLFVVKTHVLNQEIQHG